nr:polysaccharide deacetylase family protein [Porphyromonas macacae]
MKQICLYFELHQPFRLKRYRFFDIGNDHYYYDDFQNEDIFLRVAEQSYLPANKMMLELLHKHPDFKVTFSISGLAIEQMEYHKPELIESFRELAETGRVEFLATTYAHSISALYDEVEFRNQLKMHRAKIKAVFGVDTKVFHNPELIYSDDIAGWLPLKGYKRL